MTADRRQSLRARLRRRWEAFKEDEPGRRFQKRHERAHRSGKSLLHRMVFLGGGIMVFAAGLFFLPAPGPGLVIIAIGAGMIAEESLFMAKLLDRLEVRLRKLLNWAGSLWERMSAPQRILLILLAASIAAGFAYASYAVLMR